MTTQELAQKIIAIRRDAQSQINEATESSWASFLDSALDDIEKLCKESLNSETVEEKSISREIKDCSLYGVNIYSLNNKEKS